MEIALLTSPQVEDTNIEHRFSCMSNPLQVAYVDCEHTLEEEHTTYVRMYKMPDFADCENIKTIFFVVHSQSRNPSHLERVSEVLSI